MQSSQLRTACLLKNGFRFADKIFRVAMTAELAVTNDPRGERPSWRLHARRANSGP